VAFPPASQPATLRMSPATIANIGDVHVDAYANSSTLSRRGLEKRKITTNVNKIWCGVSGGGVAAYDEGKEKFDGFIVRQSGNAVNTLIEAARYVAQNDLCNVSGGLCDMIIDATLDIPGLLLADEITDFFDGAFDAIRKHCRETGGGAELIADPPQGSDVCGIPTCTVDGKMALKVAHLQAEFVEHDGGATCPANPPPANICEISSFN
jgi:hypothetical protein